MGIDAVRDWLHGLEAQLDAGPVDERWTMLAWVAGRNVALGERELRESLRRALLLRAAGGDPHRELALDERAVTSLAEDLDAPEHRTQLMAGVDELVGLAQRLPRVRSALFDLAASPDSAWRAYACGLLAEELGDDEHDDDGEPD